LADGELAINLTDEKLYFKNAAGTVKLLAANITPVANGGTGATTAGNARTNLGSTTLGSNLFTITNPGAVTFPRFNADNTVSSLSAADFRTAIGAGTGGGDVSGPASATNNALAAFDGTTGKLIKNASLTANNVLLGNGTGAPQVVAPGTVGNVLTSNGTTWTSAAGGGGGAEAFITQSTGGNQPPGSFNPSDSFALI
jgi:hypothetical protein